MIVIRDGSVVENYPVSYGKEAEPGRNTVSGIHVVTEKYPEFKMCNPQFGYCNVPEKWAVRINNNGEFIHNNTFVEKQGLLGVENVSHGCINMGGSGRRGVLQVRAVRRPGGSDRNRGTHDRGRRHLRLEVLLGRLEEALPVELLSR